MRKDNRISVILAAACVILGCTGCGSASDENIQAGMTAIQELDYNTALSNFETALLSGEDIRLISRGQGMAYLGLTQYEDAAAAFEKSLANSSCILDDMDYDINYYLAAAYYKAEKYQEAKAVYDAILALKPKEADAYFLRGSVLLDLDNFEGARSDFEKTIELANTDYDRLLSIFEVLDQYGYKELGQQYLQTALDAEDKSMTNYDKGRIYFYLEDFESARNYLQQAGDAGDAGAAYYLGKTWEALGEYNYAASVYNSYIQDKGESALIYNQLALCHMQLEDFDAALKDIHSGLQMQDADMMQTLYFNQIVIYEYQGDFAKAASLMETYVKNYPDDADAVREYEFLRTRGGRTESDESEETGEETEDTQEPDEETEPEEE